MSSAATISPALLDLTADIDAGWLESVLAPTYPGIAVRNITRRPIGAGNVSDTVHVAIDYSVRPDGAPDAVVAKFKPVAPEVHAHGLGSGAYHREIGAYRAITERSACRIPRLYHVDGDETNINLVIEDLTGAVPGNQVAGCGVAEAAAVLTQLARLHATFSPTDTLMTGTTAGWPIRMADVADYWADAARTGADQALRRYPGRLSPADLDTVAGGADLARDWFRLDQSRLTLTHGDPRVDNVLFEATAAGTGAVLLDWQVTGLRNPMYDVGYFLSGSVSVADRRAHEHDLLAGYLDTFGAIHPGYSVAEATDDLRTQILSGLMITTAAIAVLPDIDLVNTLIVALLERNCAAAQDWDALAATRVRLGG